MMSEGRGAEVPTRVQKSKGMSSGRWIPEHTPGETELRFEGLAPVKDRSGGGRSLGDRNSICGSPMLGWTMVLLRD